MAEHVVRISRLPMYFLVIGAAVKTALVVLWRLYQPAHLYKLIITYDPIGIWVSETVTPLFFDQRRFAPTPSEAVFYEIVLILSFGIECLVLGLILKMIMSKIFKQ
jgi:hypothetical protein